MDELLRTIIGLVVVLLALTKAVALYDHFRQRPLGEYSKKETQLAFGFAPEAQISMERRGSMSRQEFTRLRQLNLKRIYTELARRGRMM